MSEQGLATPQRYWAALVVGIGIFLSVIDSTIISLALPIIARDFNVTNAQSVLVVNSYQLVVAMFLIPFAVLGDKIGFRRVFLGGFIVFTLASIWCAFTESFYSLVMARALQGIGGAGVMCVSTAVIRFIYPPEKLGRGISTNAMIVAGSFALGPSIGSGILAIADWSWFFLINIPIGILGIIIGFKVLPKNELSKKPFDTVSAILSALTFGSMLLFMEELGHGQTLPYLLIILAFTLCIGWIFIRRQLSIEQPMMPVDLMRNPLFALSVVTGLFSFCGQMLTLIALPFFLSGNLGIDPVRIGLLFTAWPLSILCIAPFAGRMADKYSAGILGGIGLFTAASGYILLSQLEANASTFNIVASIAICGLGLGLFQSPNTRFIVSSAPRNRTGSVSGLVGTVRQTGQTIGASLAALMLYLYADDYGRSAFVLAAIIAVIAALFSLSRILPSLQIHHKS